MQNLIYNNEENSENVNKNINISETKKAEDILIFEGLEMLLFLENYSEFINLYDFENE